MCADGMCCTACGAAFGEGDRYCRVCGLPVQGGVRVNEHRYVTALFSDLSGYTRLSSLLDTEELKSLMESIFAEALRAISSYGGVVEKFLGDAVVALFGIHRIHEDDIIRAVSCAKTIHGFVENRYSGPKGTGHGKLSMHTGIHAGIVLVDDAGKVPLYQGVIGMPIIVAQRLSSLAAPGEILIGGSSRYEAERFFEIESLGKRHLKGIPEPMEIYRIGSRRRVPLGIRRPGVMSGPMVGRERELSFLRRAFEDLIHGAGGSVLITGEAGVGKSRLVHEFCELVEGRALVAAVQCLDHMSDTPYHPVISLVRRLVDAMSSQGCTLEDGLLSPRHSFHVRSLLGSRQGDEDLMPDVWKMEICEAVSGLLKALAKDRPVVVCIEDLHWADATSKDLISYLLQEEGRGPGCLFLITSRESDAIDACGEVLAVPEISRDDMEILLRSLLKVPVIPGDAADALYRITGGNPLYLEEYVSYLGEEGRELLSVSEQAVGSRIPETVQGLISARMENLDREEKRLLQEASVLGTVFGGELLDAVTSVRGDTTALLGRLELAGFITRAAGGEYRFRHALTREVASMTLLGRHRRELHKKVGLHLEKISKTRAEHCGMIAYHMFHAREYARAVPYFILAARTYQAEGSWIEAAAQYQRAEESVLKADDFPGRDETLVQMREGIWTCSRVFSPERAINALEELVRHYGGKGPKSHELFSKIRLINLYSQKARFQDALDLYEEVSRQARDSDFLAAAAKTAVAYTYTFLGMPKTALSFLEDARGGLDPSEKFLAAVNSLTTLAAWVWRGDVREALAWYVRTKQLSAPYMDLDLMADVWHAYLLFLKGDFPGAQGLFDVIRDKERKLGSLAGGFSYLRIQSSIYVYSRYTLWVDKAREELDMLESRGRDRELFPGLMGLYRAWVALGLKRYREAGDLAQECLPLLEKGVANRVPYALNTLAEALLMLGELPSARAAAERAIEWNERHGNAEQLIWAYRTMASIRLGMQDRPSAFELLKKASFLSTDRGMKPHIAWTLSSWGDFHAACGARRKARTCYRKAAALWSAMGIPQHTKTAGPGDLP
ncbi:MAG: Adenylate cyclase 2 [Deltaproteobacteria bacterium ADurb.BinA179]|nr:MAG: Adenylate cyclase 2 [Deltaproteobacteria bacterium ADurb.BinA179]